MENSSENLDERDRAKWRKWFLAYVALALAVFIWGANFAVVKVATETWGNYFFTLIAIRFWIAFLVYKILGFAFPSVFRSPDRNQLKFPLWPTFFVGLTLAIGYGCQTRYLTDGTPLRAAFLTSTTVFWAAIISRLFGKSLPMATVAGCILATVGVILLEGIDVQTPFLVSLLAIVAAIAFAIEILLVSKYIPTAGVTEWTARTAAVVAIIASLFAIVIDGPRWPPPVNFQVIAAILFMGIVATAVALFLQNWSQAQVFRGRKILDGPRVALISSFEPVFAALVSVFFLRDNLSAAGAFGCILILIGVFTSEVSAARSASRE